jgi:hypothetical protein
VGAQAIPVLTETNAVFRGGAYGEARLVQPALMLQAGALSDRILLFGTGDFEGLTMKNGELTAGAWGEGFIDRRHPHTYLHELMVLAPDLLRDLGTPVHLKLGLGKGFVPFGSDDPMSRPVERFPVNHHLSQILERAVGFAGVRVGPAELEGSLFNGDEPLTPSTWPNLSRFGDSWALRLTVRPTPELEWQGSRAFVRSPENRDAQGLDASKWSSSVRWEGPVLSHPVYAMAEWAQTNEGGVYTLHSVLVETEVTVGAHRPYVRFERTDRPEDERTLDPFRLQRPIVENSILGVTRWTITTVGYALDAGRVWQVSWRPFVEGSLIGIGSVGGGLFNPVLFYGTSRHWSVTTGIRLRWGAGREMTGHRMGHYEQPGDMSGMSMPGGSEQ